MDLKTLYDAPPWEWPVDSGGEGDDEYEDDEYMR
jgi:hypothetical protein